MKKIISLALCLLLVFSFAACGNKKDRLNIGTFEIFEIGNYVINLPSRYEYNDLVAVGAEPTCIAMLTDEKGELPDLWIYEDECEGSSIKAHIKNMDEVWDYKELSIYIVEGTNVARTYYDEDWYGANLINEHYYKIGDKNKVLSFDFAYKETDDTESKHAFVLAIAEELGF